MPDYKVQENDTLASIACDKGFLSAATIYQAHNKMCEATNYSKYRKLPDPNTPLIAGENIFYPDSQTKKLDQSSGTCPTYAVVCKEQQFLRLKIEDTYNEIISVKDDLKLFINGGSVKINDDTNYSLDEVIYKKISTLDPLPDKLAKNTPGKAPDNNYLEVKITCPLTGKNDAPPVKIALEIGGLDPIVDPNAKNTGKATKSIEAKKAVQKILQNLGHYNKDFPIDGDLEKVDSYMAIANFQIKYMDTIDLSVPGVVGRPTVETLGLLISKSGVSVPFQPIEFKKLTEKENNDLKIPLFLRGEGAVFVTIGEGWEQRHFGPDIAEKALVSVNKFQKYVNRAVNWSKNGIKELKSVHSKAPFFAAKTAFVTPSPTNSDGITNILRNEPGQFVFLDAGRWKNQARDFGLVWGRHVYLCSYEISGSGQHGTPFNEKVAGRTEGLDLDFFKAFNKEGSKAKGKINIQACAYMNWGKDTDYEDTKIQVILPDMHLMRPEVAHIWYRVLDKDGAGYVFLKAERDLFDFVTDLTVRTTGLDLAKVKVVNLGDVYDLWVGMGTSVKEDGEKNLPLFNHKNIKEPGYNGEKVVIIDSGPFYAYDYEFSPPKETRYEGGKMSKYNFIIEGIKGIQKLMVKHLSQEFPRENELTEADKKCNEAKIDLDKEKADYQKLRAAYMKAAGGRGFFPTTNWKVDEAQKVYDQAKSEYDNLKADRDNWYGKSSKRVGKSDSNLEALNRWIDLNENAINEFKGSDKKDWEKDWDYLNPAEAAFRKLEHTKGLTITYINGNHDSYLADEELTKQAGLRKRESFVHEKALFVEHGQRLEACFLNHNHRYELDKKTRDELEDMGVQLWQGIDKADTLGDLRDKHPWIVNGGSVVLATPIGQLVAGSAATVSAGYVLVNTKMLSEADIPTNDDGNFSGFVATCDVFNAEAKNHDFTKRDYIRNVKYVAADKADVVAGTHDQRIYRRELARYYLGEKVNGETPPGVFVIGHTHMPQLIHAKVKMEVPPNKRQDDVYKANEKAKDDAAIEKTEAMTRGLKY